MNIYDKDTVDGRNPAPVDRWFILLFTRVYYIQVVQDFFHQQHVKILLGVKTPSEHHRFLIFGSACRHIWNQIVRINFCDPGPQSKKMWATSFWHMCGSNPWRHMENNHIEWCGFPPKGHLHLNRFSGKSLNFAEGYGRWFSDMDPNKHAHISKLSWTWLS